MDFDIFGHYFLTLLLIVCDPLEPNWAEAPLQNRPNGSKQSEKNLFRSTLDTIVIVLGPDALTPFKKAALSFSVAYGAGLLVSVA